MPSPQTLTLRRLDDSAACTAALQDVLAQAPGYALRTSGLPVAPDAAQSLLRQRPPGTAAQAKFVFGLYLGPALIGCADVIRGWPDAATAHIGLLLVAEPWQRQGYGRRAYALLESGIRAWRECQRVRIGVVQRNAPQALPFWQALGFAPIGEVKPYQNGLVRSKTLVLTRTLP